MNTTWVKAAKLQAELMLHGYFDLHPTRLCPKRGFTVHEEFPLEGKPISKFMNQSSVFSSFVKETRFLALEKPFFLDLSSQANIKDE